MYYGIHNALAFLHVQFTHRQQIVFDMWSVLDFTEAIEFVSTFWELLIFNTNALSFVSWQIKFVISHTYIQSAALIAVTNNHEWLDEYSIRKTVLPKMKVIYEKNVMDFKMVVNVLGCVELTLDKLDRTQVSAIVQVIETSSINNI